MRFRLPARRASVGLAVATIALGLWVHRGGGALGASALNADARDVLGDALWAMMMGWWMGAVAPRAALPTRSAAALGICVVVECSQLIHAPTLDAIRRTTLGHLVLGSGFDPRDLVAYAIGVMFAALVEWRVLAAIATTDPGRPDNVA